MVTLARLVKEIKFKKYKSHRHIMDVPMFSIFIDTKLDPAEADRLVYTRLDEIKKIFADAKYAINKMGFPSMHANVLISKHSEDYIHSTGTIGAAGYAHHGLKYMSLDRESIDVDVIVHEWAHLWMMNNSKAFKKAIIDLYNQLMVQTAGEVRSQHIPEWKPTYEADRKMLDMWGRWSGQLVTFGINEPSSQWFFWKGKKVKYENIELLPQGISFEAILTLPLNVQTLHGVSKILPKGSKVYAEKGNSGWLIGQYDKNGDRFETLTKGFQAIWQLVKAPRGRGDIFQELDKALRLSTQRHKEYRTTSYLVGSILEKIQSAMSHSMEDMLKFAVVSQQSMKEPMEKVKKWAEYVLPNYLKILKNENLIPFYRVNPEKAYDFLWVHNENKPASLSAIEEVKEAKRKDALQSYSDVFAKGKNLSGKEFTVHRDIMKNLQNWVNSYGMVNQDELWATAVELFLRLPANHKKFIINVVSQYK